MYRHVGSAIKTLATVFCCIGIFVSFIYGLVMISHDLIAAGIIYMLLGALGSWLGCLLLAGFGDLVKNMEVAKETLLNIEEHLLWYTRGTQASNPSMHTAPAREQQPYTVCPVCGASCQVGTSFCVHCGNSLSQQNQGL